MAIEFKNMRDLCTVVEYFDQNPKILEQAIELAEEGADIMFHNIGLAAVRTGGSVNKELLDKARAMVVAGDMLRVIKNYKEVGNNTSITIDNELYPNARTWNDPDFTVTFGSKCIGRCIEDTDDDEDDD